MRRFLSFDKKQIIFKAFFESQFKYCPLVRMIHGREVNQRINRLHERALRLVYNDFNSTFEDMYELKISSPYSKQKGHFYYSISTLKSFFLCKLPCPTSFPCKNLSSIIFQIAIESYLTVVSD